MKFVKSQSRVSQESVKSAKISQILKLVQLANGLVDSDKGSADDHLGIVELNVDNIRSALFQDGWFDLDITSKIRIRISGFQLSKILIQTDKDKKLSKVVEK